MLSRIVLAVVVMVLSPRVVLADVVQEWNVTMLLTLSGQTPFASARYAAITQLAVFEAVNAITRDYRPYIGGVAAPSWASVDAAAASAAHSVLKAYFPAKAAALDAALTASLDGVTAGDAKSAGIAAGQAAAAAILALRANDGSVPPESYLPPSDSPGQWQLTPSCPATGGVLRHWGRVAPFGLRSSDQFRLDPPPVVGSAKYAKDYAEVKAAGGVDSIVRTQDLADVARVFALLSPVTWSNSAARQLSAAQGQSVAENARAFALLNMALSDATVAAFDSKYHYDFWRPETAIRAGDADGNAKTDGDESFAPFIVTPCFPSYPSNHASVSYAAREVLERLYGRDGHDITLTTASVPGVTLHYTNLEAITDDVDDARVYGGIHFRFDQEAGGRQGRGVGTYVYQHNLRPAQHD